MRKFISDNNLYLLTNDKRIFSFYYQYPDKIGMGETFIGKEREEEADKIATECEPTLMWELRNYIEDNGCWKKGNHLKMIDYLSRLFSINEDETKDYLGYNETAIKVYDQIKQDGFHDYYDCLSHLQEWNWDEERVIKYMNSSLNKKWDGVFVDIFPSEEDRKRPTWPTEYFLLHRFYNSWSEDLDKLISEAVEKYPDPHDYDLAGYYMLEKLEEEQKRRIEIMKKKHEEDNNKQQV